MSPGHPQATADGPALGLLAGGQDGQAKNAVQEGGPGAVTGQELMLVDGGHDDDDRGIISAEEGEQQRARLADRFLAVQVIPSAYSGPHTVG